MKDPTVRIGSPADEMRTERTKTWRWLPAVMVGNAVLALIGLGSESLWLDERLSLRIVQENLGGAISIFRDLPEQHPFYYVLLKIWRVFGESEFALRSLSAVFAVACVFAIYRLAQRVLDEASARIASIVMATSPYMLFFSQEARMYSLLGLLTIVSTYLLIRWWDDERGLVGYTALGIVGAYTHIFFLFLLGAHLVWAVARRPALNQRAVRLLRAHCIVGLCYVPWLFMIFSGSLGSQSWKSAINVVLAAPYTFLRFSVGYSEVIANYDWKTRAPDLIRSQLPLLITVAVGYSVVAVYGFKRLTTHARHGSIVPIGLFAPMILATVASLITIVVGERYFMVCFPFFVLLLAAGISSLLEPSMHRAARVVVVAAFAAIVAHTLFDYYTDEEFGKEQWRDVAAYLSENTSNDDLIVLHQPHIEKAFAHYFGEEAGARVVRSDPALTPRLLAQPQFWIVLAHPASEDDFVTQFTPRFRIAEERLFPQQSGIRTFLLVRNSNDPAGD